MAPRLQFRLLPDDHFGPDRDALIEVGDVGVLLSLGDSGKVVGSRGGVVGHLYNYFFLIVFLIGIAIVLLASEFGWRLGTRTEGQPASGNISALEQSLLGLLALIVGFTFLMALTRFEARREAVLNEANAIGTTALRARLLPEPDGITEATSGICPDTDRLHPDGQVFCGTTDSY